jgi:Zn-dependent membrane protease YugP
MFFDPLYLLFMLPATLVGIWAQFKLRSAYGRYSRVGLASRLSGAEAAREILDRAGLHHVPVEEVPGHLTDHYDPTKRALRLSSENFRSQSVAAVGVAAHEAGHALQHQVGYAPLQLRAALVPMTQIASYAWIVLILLGMFLKMSGLIYVGIGVFSVMMLFQLVTLPVEFDASKRAKEQLLSLGIVRSDESAGVSKVLSAAALTYVAALVSSVMQLLYFLNVARSSDRD